MTRRFRIQLAAIFLYLLSFQGYAQYEINPAEGYTPHIGAMVSMLEDIKSRITAQVQDLNQAQTDFLFDDNANSIGSLIMHLAATEAYYQVETLEGRPWDASEEAFWSTSIELGDASRAALKDKPISYYLNIWDDVRQKTLEGLKEKDDDWFASSVDENMNYHFAWYHILEHQANHMGQIALVKNRFPE